MASMKKLCQRTNFVCDGIIGLLLALKKFRSFARLVDCHDIILYGLYLRCKSKFDKTMSGTTS